MTTTIQTLHQKYLKNLPAWEADSLMQLSCNKEKAFVLTHPQYRFSFLQLLRFLYFLFRFKRGVPLAYLTGNKEFYGLNFFVNKQTLIPRPDTEIMVEEALKNIDQPNTILVDVGTGSGCIPISILKNTKIIPQKTFAIDISKGTLTVAKKNAKKHGVNIEFVQGNLLEPVLKILKESLNTKIITTANLPYLTNDQFENEPSIRHEPKSALVASEQGLALYRDLLEQIKSLPQKMTIFFEIDPDQTNGIKKIISSTLPNSLVKIKTDLAERDRLVVINTN